MTKNLTILLALISLLTACSRNKNDPNHESLIHFYNSPAKAESGEPFLMTSLEGEVYLSWIEHSGDSTTLKFSQLKEEQWSAPVAIATGGNWFVNWADYPVMASNENKFLAHLLDRSGSGTYSYDVKVTNSVDYGRSWTKPQLLHDDGKEAEHGFVSMLPYEGGFFITWLDGRNAAMEGMEEHAGHHGAMTLRAAILDSTGTKLKEWELDNRTCDCCQTAAAITSSGPVVLYRDRSEEEVRDISIARWTGAGWSEPATIHNDQWKINGCPVNGPRVVARDQTVAVAWFTAAFDSTQVNVAFSHDGGQTFGVPVNVNDSTTIGRVDIELLDEEAVAVSWMEGGTIRVARVYLDGRKGESIIVGNSSSSRSSGFPQMVRSGDHLIFAWTDDAEQNIKLAKVKF